MATGNLHDLSSGSRDMLADRQTHTQTDHPIKLQDTNVIQSITVFVGCRYMTCPGAPTIVSGKQLTMYAKTK